jgi:hypothetical protein
MNADDPIALLRALDPADPNEVEALVAALAASAQRERIVAHSSPRPRVGRRPRLVLLTAARPRPRRRSHERSTSRAPGTSRG